MTVTDTNWLEFEYVGQFSRRSGKGNEMAEITSTAQMTPDGILGYLKGIAAVIAVSAGIAAQLLPAEWAGWAQLVVGVAGALAVVALPNKVKTIDTS